MGPFANVSGETVTRATEAVALGLAAADWVGQGAAEGAALAPVPPALADGAASDD